MPQRKMCFLCNTILYALLNSETSMLEKQCTKHSLECFRAFRMTPKRNVVHYPGYALYFVPGLIENFMETKSKELKKKRRTLRAI